MKLGCQCGATIYDGMDDLPNKAHLVPDQEWFAVYDGIDDFVIDRIADGSLDQKRAYMESRRIISKASRLMWQCNACGRIYIDDRNGNLNCYAPADGQTSKDIFRSHE